MQMGRVIRVSDAGSSLENKHAQLPRKEQHTALGVPGNWISGKEIPAFKDFDIRLVWLVTQQ